MQNTATSTPRVAGLLFCSGFCALIYQTVWFREFRMIFGASTAASAAVLGIFMAGIGTGSAWFGKRSEETERPLLLYGNLELLISISAALTLPGLWLVREIYVAIGGTSTLGQGLGTVMRLLLAFAVLIAPTFLMGGTLPAAARAASSTEDVARRGLAFLYGCNTLGAVVGVGASTFFLIEHLGNRHTLWFAAILNLAVAILARGMGKSAEAVTHVAETNPVKNKAPIRFVVFAAGCTGFVFMLMELVWYRMLSPILGGSTFTFGMILMVALLGISIGGGVYALAQDNRPTTLNAFAITCGLEALLVAVPFALGDRLAIIALQLRSWNVLGFSGQIMGWLVITGIIVLPVAIVAGFQFPLLMSLLGRGRDNVGRHAGLAFAANTTGAILGSLLGGFGLLTFLGAPGVWRMVILLMALLAITAAIIHIISRKPSIFAPILAGIALVLVLQTGPTAAWRHSGIGAGRASLDAPTINATIDFLHSFRRNVFWEKEGVESSVAMSDNLSYAFIINGKIDGNARVDDGTQVMGGLIGALIHPSPKRALVIGLGTGSTAGWLASIPEMERVDVIELEPATLEVAKACAPVNQHVLENPKVRIIIGDARELLLTTREKYDIIFSEPSNPYRLGIACLFSQEFYKAADRCLAKGGVFLQWLQAYEIDSAAISNAYATIGSVFPSVDTWCTQHNDLLLFACREPFVFETEKLRKKITQTPFRTALMNVWRVDSLEGVLSHFLANDSFARAIVESGIPVSTDNLNLLEFGFARSVGQDHSGSYLRDIKKIAATRNWQLPLLIIGSINWEAACPLGLRSISLFDGGTAPQRHIQEILAAYLDGDFLKAGNLWVGNPIEPASPFELQAVAAALSQINHEKALPYIEQLGASRPHDAHALKARLYSQKRQWPEAVSELSLAFDGWRQDAWGDTFLIGHTLDLAAWIAGASGNPEIAQSLFTGLQEPLAVHVGEEKRKFTRLEIARHTGTQSSENTRTAIDAFGRNVPWQRDFLTRRSDIYTALNDPRQEAAASALRRFIHHEHKTLVDELEKLTKK